MRDEAGEELVRVARNPKGVALVATRDLPAGAHVAIFEGPFVGFGEIPPEELRHVLWFDTDRWMIPRAPARFINHGCEPNCALHDRAGDPDRCDIVTRRPVHAGEELTISYDLVDAEEWYAHRDHPAYAFWHPSWSFDCACGAPSCRRRIDRYVLTGDIAARRRRHGDQKKA